MTLYFPVRTPSAWKLQSFVLESFVMESSVVEGLGLDVNSRICMKRRFLQHAACSDAVLTSAIFMAGESISMTHYYKAWLERHHLPPQSSCNAILFEIIIILTTIVAILIYRTLNPPLHLSCNSNTTIPTMRSVTNTKAWRQQGTKLLLPRSSNWPGTEIQSASASAVQFWNRSQRN